MNLDQKLVAWLCQPVIADVADPISRRRAYLEIVAVYSAFFAASIVRAVIAVTAVTPKPVPGAVTPKPPRLGWATAGPDIVTALATAGLAVAVVVLLCRQRHRSATDLGLSPRHNASLAVEGFSPLSAWVTALTVATVGLLSFAFINSKLGAPGYEFGQRTLANFALQLATSVKAGIVEETVVLAFVVVTLAQARCRGVEVAAVAVVLRILFHLYYGPGVVPAVAVWVLIVLFVFWWGRSLFPVMIAHAFFDIAGTLHWYKVQVAGGVYGGAFLVLAAWTFVVYMRHLPSEPAPRGRSIR